MDTQPGGLKASLEKRGRSADGSQRADYPRTLKAAIGVFLVGCLSFQACYFAGQWLMEYNADSPHSDYEHVVNLMRCQTLREQVKQGWRIGKEHPRITAMQDNLLLVLLETLQIDSDRCTALGNAIEEAKERLLYS